MNRKYYLLIFIVLSTILIVSSAAFICLSNRNQETMPDGVYGFSDFSLGQNQGSPNHNISQGDTYQINYTLYSSCFEQFTVKIENLTLAKYASFESLATVWDSSWDSSIPQETVFNYSLSLSQLTLQSCMFNSSIITLKWADNAPPGKYIIYVNMGKPVFSTEPSKYDSVPSFTPATMITVNPKTDQ